MLPDIHADLVKIKNFLLDHQIKFKEHHHFLEIDFKLFDQIVRLMIGVTIHNKLELTCKYFAIDRYSSFKDFKFNKYIVKKDKTQLRFSPELNKQNLTVDFVCNMILQTKNTVKEINTLAYSSILPFHYSYKG